MPEEFTDWLRAPLFGRTEKIKRWITESLHRKTRDKARFIYVFPF
jgi:hypothetical protein